MSQIWSEGERTGWRQLTLDGALGLAVALLSLATGSVYGGWGLLAGVLLAAAVAIRRRLLVPMVVLATTSAVVQLASTQVLALQDIAYALLFYVLGVHSDTRARRAGLWLAITAALVGGGYLGGVDAVRGGSLTTYSPGRAVVFAAVTALVTVGGWTAGLVRRQQRTALRSRVDAELDAAERRRLAERVDQAQERNRIAADMHDAVTHSLAVVAAQADGAHYSLRTSAAGTAGTEHALDVIGETAREAIGDLRRIIGRLRTGDDDGYRAGVVDQDRLFERMTASGMRLELHQEGTRRAGSLADLVAGRLLTEALTNALKHGDLDQPVVVRQDWRGGYHLRVVNAVRGGPPASTGTGHGITGMHERVAVAGGALTAEPSGGRFVLRADLPGAPLPAAGTAPVHPTTREFR